MNMFKECRKKQHLTQREVADYCGIKSASLVAMWENGSRFPSIKTLCKLAELFNVPLEELVKSEAL